MSSEKTELTLDDLPILLSTVEVALNSLDVNFAGFTILSPNFPFTIIPLLLFGVHSAIISVQPRKLVETQTIGSESAKSSVIQDYLAKMEDIKTRGDRLLKCVAQLRVDIDRFCPDLIPAYDFLSMIDHALIGLKNETQEMINFATEKSNKKLGLEVKL